MDEEMIEIKVKWNISKAMAVFLELSRNQS